MSQDPLALIDKVLDQNSGSYAKLDDLIDIARNLVAAGLPPTEDEDAAPAGIDEMVGKQLIAERRVIAMAVEAALREDDFETSYSYVVNRFSSVERAGGDDISWRAAFLAGRYRPTSTSPPPLRRLEQRTELLSLALLLAPTSALPDILAVWRRCEEESAAQLAVQSRTDEAFDDAADKHSALPGNFTADTDGPPLLLNQRRRELGRWSGPGNENAEAPMSMFDVARGAAKALSKSFPQQKSAVEGDMSDAADRADGDAEARLRKRDLVANAAGAVSGGLASGLGWMLGATPVHQQGRERE